jgi:triphosphoribosyl-dephospho-CoA synthase
VHPGKEFADLKFTDFVESANTIAPILARTRHVGVGPTILKAITATRSAVGKNTNLGIVLLLAPLASVPMKLRLAEGLFAILNELTTNDAQLVYEAIRVAMPGGMGEVSQQDVSQTPTQSLLEVMQLAAERDRVAAQYANGFEQVLEVGVPFLASHAWTDSTWENSVIGLHLTLMSRFPDSLIARKRNLSEANQAANLAQAVLDDGWPDSNTGQRKLEQLDEWLREFGHQRNPGTTADLVTACLFAAFREGNLSTDCIAVAK